MAPLGNLGVRSLGAEEFRTILDVKLVFGGLWQPKLRYVGPLGRILVVRASFGGTLGDHLGTLWIHLGTIWGPFREPSGPFGEPLEPFGYPWGSKYGTWEVPRAKV